MPAVPIKITEEEAFAIRATRPDYDDDRGRDARAEQRNVFARIKQRYGLDSDIKLRVELDDEDDDDYLVLKDKRTGRKLERFVPEQRTETPSFADMAAKTFARAEESKPGPVPGSKRIGVISIEDLIDLLRDEARDKKSFDTRPPTPDVDGSRQVLILSDKVFFVL